MSHFFRRSASLVAVGVAGGAFFKANVIPTFVEDNSGVKNNESIRRRGIFFLLGSNDSSSSSPSSSSPSTPKTSTMIVYAQQQHPSSDSEIKVAGHRREDLPDIDLGTIEQHVGKKKGGAGGGDNRIFVTYKAGVYDITEFVEQHPGGKKRIMLAAGGSIEKYWQQVTIHNEDAVRTILESMRIGNVKGYDPTKKNGGIGPSSGSAAAGDEDDEVARLWGSEPHRAAALEVIAARPFNAQAPDIALDTYLTPNELFFVRNHMPVPLIKEDYVEVAPSAHPRPSAKGVGEVTLFLTASAAASAAAKRGAIKQSKQKKSGDADEEEEGEEEETPNKKGSDENDDDEGKSSLAISKLSDSNPFCLQVEGIGLKPHCFTLPELRALFKERTVATTIECGGNRRTEMSPVADALKKNAVKGLPWTNGAISTAEWSGFLLSDVLDFCKAAADAEEKRRVSQEEALTKAKRTTMSTTMAQAKQAKNHDGKERSSSSSSSEKQKNVGNVSPSEKDGKAFSNPSSPPTPTHVQFQGADSDVAGHFAVSVPYGLALDHSRQTIIATKMNGETIPRDHGYPLRAIVPGTVGVRNCKWLNKVTLTTEEAKTVWQQHDYKNFPSYSTKPDPSLPSVYAMPVTSAITDIGFDENGAGSTDHGNVEVEVPLTAFAPAEIDAQPAVHHRRISISPTRVAIKGYAYTGSGAGIQRVEVSPDGGQTFIQSARLYKNNHPVTVVAPEEAEEDDAKIIKKGGFLGLKTGLSNVTADNLYNAVHKTHEEKSPSSAAPLGLSCTSAEGPSLDWTWSLFSTALDVTKVTPSRFIILPNKKENDKQDQGKENELGGSANTDDNKENKDHQPLPPPFRYFPCWKVCSRAVANDNASQPPLGSYNFRGLLYNGYSCREVCKEIDEDDE